MAEVSGWYDQVSLAERAAAEWLAVLGLADTTTLAALLSEAPETVLQGLNTRGVIELTSDGWQLTADAHDTVLAALRTEPDRLYALYKQALEHCAQLLALASPQERARAEAAYMRVLEPCCEALIQQQPTALSEVAEAAPLDLLAEVRHRQLVLFYRSLGLGLRESYDAALDGFDALLSDPALDETIRGRALNSGAVFARHQGDYERALEGYQQSQQIWERLGNRARQGLALLNRGVLSYYVQDYAAAERDLYASLSLFRDVEAIHSQGLALMNLGLLGRDLGHWQEALSFFEQAAEMFKQSGAVHFLGMLANNIGEVEMLRGRLEAARLQFEQGADDHPCLRCGCAPELGLARPSAGR
jgi:tetratricopeptide (TPR) repeat protein